ncbi:MAG TPA: caspase family protein [Dehalococcoidia bacterium]|nr:caspase family protein [Dehalococcoidia bacterium]
MRRIWVGTVVAGIALAMAAPALLVFVAGHGTTERAAAAGPVYRLSRGLGNGGDADIQNNAIHLADALKGGSNWAGTTIEAWYTATLKNLTDPKLGVPADFAGAKAGDVSIFYYSGHGTSRNDSDPKDEADSGDAIKTGCTKLPCDEGIAPTGPFVYDDDLPPVFANVAGTKILIFDACYSGGIADAVADLQPGKDLIVLTSAGTNQTSASFAAWGTGKDRHAHDYFSGYLIEGLANDGTGNARADSSNPKDGVVTLGEWFTYARDNTDLLSRNPTITGPGGPFTPLKFPKAGGEDIHIIEYTPGKLATEHVRADPNGNYGGGKRTARCEDAVGGIAGPVTLTGDAPANSSGGSGPSAGAVGAIAGGAAAAMVLAVAGGWYARRRWVR